MHRSSDMTKNILDRGRRNKGLHVTIILRARVIVSVEVISGMSSLVLSKALCWNVDSVRKVIQAPTKSKESNLARGVC